MKKLGNGKNKSSMYSSQYNLDFGLGDSSSEEVVSVQHVHYREFFSSNNRQNQLFLVHMKNTEDKSHHLKLVDLANRVHDVYPI